MMTERKLSAGMVEGIAALAMACAKRAQTELNSAADGVPSLAFAPTQSTEMLGLAADLRARAAQAASASGSLSAAASSFETLAEVMSGSVPLVVAQASKHPVKRPR